MIHTVTLEEQGEHPVPLGTMCSALMTVGIGNRKKGRGRAGKRLPCPMKATRLVGTQHYCDEHGPTRWRRDPFYESAEWKSLRRKALDRDGHTCRYCGNVATQADHVIARTKGGSDSIDNLAACCALCNKIASGTLFGSFSEKERYIRGALRTIKLR